MNQGEKSKNIITRWITVQIEGWINEWLSESNKRISEKENEWMHELSN